MHSPAASDAMFAGSIPELYDRLLVPMLFVPYADDLARRIASVSPERVLETAAGSGAVTRALAHTLPGRCEIVATDLNAPMLDRAQAVGTARPVEWQQADAQALPFADASFDVVICQFGAMFFPDKARAFAEARRVLRPGGRFVFSVWDRLETNELAATTVEALTKLLPADMPPRFIARTPHGYYERAAVEADLAAGGFGALGWDTLEARSHAVSPEVPARAFCEGTPQRGEIEAAGVSLTEATAICAAALAARFGDGPIAGRIVAHVVSVTKS